MNDATKQQIIHVLSAMEFDRQPVVNVRNNGFPTAPDMVTFRVATEDGTLHYASFPLDFTLNDSEGETIHEI